MAKRKTSPRTRRVAQWRKQVFRVWQDERQKRHAEGSAPGSNTLQSDTGVDILADTGQPILVQ